jgi:aminoglycoside phosphotransferase family enzyme
MAVGPNDQEHASWLVSILGERAYKSARPMNTSMCDAYGEEP